MRKTPNIYKLKDLLRAGTDEWPGAGLPDGRYVPARPIGFWSIAYRIRAAWLVWLGRADAVIWPGGQ